MRNAVLACLRRCEPIAANANLIRRYFGPETMATIAAVIEHEDVGQALLIAR